MAHFLCVLMCAFPHLLQQGWFPLNLSDPTVKSLVRWLGCWPRFSLPYCLLTWLVKC